MEHRYRVRVVPVLDLQLELLRIDLLETQEKVGSATRGRIIRTS